MADALSRPFSVRLPLDQLEHLDTLTRLTRRSRNALIVQAIEHFVAEETAVIQACQQATDVVLSADNINVSYPSVREWLQTWGSSDEAAATAKLESQSQQSESRVINDR